MPGLPIDCTVTVGTIKADNKEVESMNCPTCQNEARRFGKNRNGSQRYQCLACKKTFTPAGDGPLGAMRIDPAKAILCLRMMLEGTSIRSIERRAKAVSVTRWM